MSFNLISDRIMNSIYSEFGLAEASKFTLQERRLMSETLASFIRNNTIDFHQTLNTHVLHGEKGLMSKITNFLNKKNVSYFTQSSTTNLNSCVEELCNKGISIIPNFFSQEYCSELDKFFDTKLLYPSHVPEYSKKEKMITLEMARQSGLPHCCYAPEDVFSTKLFLPLFLNKFCLSVAERYFECLPTFYSLNAFRSFPNSGPNPGITTLHRDYDDFKFLAFFIYLTDTDENNGAFCYVPGSHNGAPSENQNIIVASGKKGTLIIVDSWGSHMGLVPLQNERHAIWWRYGLGKNFAFRHDNNEKLQFHKSFLRDFSSDTLKYIYRLPLTKAMG